MHGERPKLTSRPWNDRSNTLGLLPGKSDEQDQALRRIIEQLPLPERSEVEVVGAKGGARRLSAEQLFVAQLSRGSFVRRHNGQWDATDPVRYWAKSDDNIYLALHIQCNVKFFAELLASIDDDTRTTDLLKAAEEYGLYWNSPDQIHRRLGWLQSLGLVERWGFSRLVVTDAGRTFLKEAAPTAVDEARGNPTVTEDEATELPPAHELARIASSKLGADELRSRKTLIGYIPRGQKSVGRPSDEAQISAADATRKFLDLFDERMSAEELFRRASAEFGLKKSSFTQSMHTFRNMHVVDMVAYNQYGVTQEGKTFLKPGNELDLVRFLHTRYRFVGEILGVAGQTMTVSDLARIANHDFGCEQIDTSEIRTRLSFMVDAGLVRRVDWTRYVATALGGALASELPLESKLPSPGESESSGIGGLAETGVSVAGRATSVGPLKDELVRCSMLNDATSAEFEQVVALAFEALGFRAEHIGGPGRTDVLVTAELPEPERYSSIVDAKGSSSGMVGDNAIKFDALKDHLRRHSANYGIVIGPDFASRVKDWAQSNGFVLLTANELAGLIERQEESPLSLGELRALFDPKKSGLETLEGTFDDRVNEFALLRNLVDVLAEEANDEDPVAGGQISLENLQYAMKTKMNPRPGRKEVEAALALLTSPLLRAVNVKDERYKLVDSPSNIVRRLRTLSVAVGR